MSDVVQQGGDPDVGAGRVAETAKVAALLEQAEGAPRERVCAERVLKTRMAGARIHQECQPELPHISQPLIDTAAFSGCDMCGNSGWHSWCIRAPSHSRFEHALGTYSLRAGALGLLEERGDLRVSATRPAPTSGSPPCCTTSDIIRFRTRSRRSERCTTKRWRAPLICEGEIGQILRESLGGGCARANRGADPRKERQSASGTHLRLSGPGQDRVSPARRGSCAAFPTERSTPTVS